jgi:hypothetical protein
MYISNQVSQVNADPGLTQSAQISVLNKAKRADADAVLPLIDSATQQSQQIQAGNPVYLGQNIDTRA